MMRARTKTSRRTQRGLTLLELLVGVFIAIFLTAAAVAFAAHETRLMGVSQARLEASSAGRAALDLLADDLAMAGAGVGHFENGDFAGVDLGPFTIDLCNFNVDGLPLGFNPPLPLPLGAGTDLNLMTVDATGLAQAPYTLRSSDIGIRFADGAYTTIAQYNSAGAGQFCLAPGLLVNGQPNPSTISFKANELAVMRTADGLAARTVQVLSPNTLAACSFGVCAGGCADFAFAATADFQSSANVAGLEYQGGELQGGFKQIAWFIASDGTNGTLRRYDTTIGPCPGRGNAAGGSVVDNAETLQAQMYQYITDPAVFAGAPAWVNVGQSNVNTRFRTRVDLELVVRAARSVERMRDPTRLLLQTGACVPNLAGCGTQVDFGDREVFRTSVEIKNAMF